MPARWGLALGVIIALAGVVPVDAGGPGLPDGFSDELLVTVTAPTALAFTPDGEMLVATQAGRLYRHDPASEAALGDPVLDLSSRTCSNLERGLLGVAVDPDYEANGFVYAFYTTPRPGDDGGTDCVHRVSRFFDGGDSIDPDSERVLVDGIPSQNANHNGGDLAFGPDGHLYVSVGDGGCDYTIGIDGGGGCAGANNAARDEHVLVGKILRITADGGVPADNPFAGPGADRCAATGRTERGRRCSETFAWGLRNPFRIAFDLDARSRRFFVNDVGQDDWEEINEGIAGADYGWNVREGPCPRGETEDCDGAPEGFTDPLYAYRHHDGCGAITGGAFVPGGVWPSEFDGAYLFSDYNCGTIFLLDEDDDGDARRRPFASGLGHGSAVHLAFGPHGDTAALYYTTFEEGGEVRRLSYTGDRNRAPTAVLAADTVSGDVPLEVRFDATGSTDPDGDDLSYTWDFGDGSGRLHTTEPTATHTYDHEGVHEATLVVRDEDGAESAPARVAIGAGRHAPELAVEVPDGTEPFAVGDEVTLTARATDAEDGDLAGRSLSWTVLLHHEDHTHPFLGPVSGTELTFVAPGPESLGAASTSHLSVHLTATDSDGLTATLSRDLEPHLVDVTFRSEPEGLDLVVNGMTREAPFTVASWEGYALDLEAPDQGQGDRRYVFDAWSHGGAARHTVPTPAGDETFTARFRRP